MLLFTQPSDLCRAQVRSASDSSTSNPASNFIPEPPCQRTDTSAQNQEHSFWRASNKSLSSHWGLLVESSKNTSERLLGLENASQSEGRNRLKDDLGLHPRRFPEGVDVYGFAEEGDDDRPLAEGSRSRRTDKSHDHFSWPWQLLPPSVHLHDLLLRSWMLQCVTARYTSRAERCASGVGNLQLLECFIFHVMHIVSFHFMLWSLTQ